MSNTLLMESCELNAKILTGVSNIIKQKTKRKKRKVNL